MNRVDKQKHTLHTILSRAKIETQLSDVANSLKEEIRYAVDLRIEARRKRKTIFLRASLAACAVAVVLIGIGLFLHANRFDYRKKQLLAHRASVYDPDQETEVSLLSGNLRRMFAANKEIVNTTNGEIYIDGACEIQADELQSDYLTLIVPKGKRASLRLCDSTQVWVNSGSTLVFPRTFNARSRHIYLQGEAYIDVCRNEKKPFFVHTDRMDVNVLGTKFNVNAYPDEPLCHVVLAEGAVNITKKHTTSSLSPGQGYFLSNDTEQVKKIDVYAYTCWKDGRMKLMDEPFDRLIRKLSRYYGVDILADTTLNAIRFDGNLNLMDSVEELISTLSLSRKLTYRKMGKQIIISADSLPVE